jgi:hypothetical protein
MAMVTPFFASVLEVSGIGEGLGPVADRKEIGEMTLQNSYLECVSPPSRRGIKRRAIPSGGSRSPRAADAVPPELPLKNCTGTW